jgi:hypothetical protein
MSARAHCRPHSFFQPAVVGPSKKKKNYRRAPLLDKKKKNTLLSSSNFPLRPTG